MEYEFLCKTFRCCIDEDCCNCPLYDFEIEHCEKQIKQQAIAFIDRQRAEIERLHEVINDFEEQSHKELMDYMQLSEKYENARAEAVREFAEFLIGEAENNVIRIGDLCDYVIVFNEMTEKEGGKG